MRIGCVDKQAHLELDVAVGHTRGVQVLHAAHNLLKEVSCIILWKAPRFANQAKQLPTCVRTIVWTMPVTSTQPMSELLKYLRAIATVHEERAALRIRPVPTACTDRSVQFAPL